MDTNLPSATTTPAIAPFQYLSSLPTKGVRHTIIEALRTWIDIPDDFLPDLLSIVGDIHNISLMLDDVEDGSPLRRSKPAAHSVFGVGQTVNSATFQLVEVIGRVAQVAGPLAQTIVLEELKNMLVAQSLDLHWVQHATPPSSQEYLQMIDGKTGALFRLIARLMIAQQSPSSTTNPPSLDRLMILFGRFFQIRDDYANLAMDQYQDSKGFCEDLDEGKWSFILLHALAHATPPTRMVLMNVLMQRHATGCAGRGHKELVLDIFRHETRSLAFTTEALWVLGQQIELEIQALERATLTANPVLREMVRSLQVGLTPSDGYGFEEVRGGGGGAVGRGARISEGVLGLLC
ncbi:FPP/GGPP synthase family protein [Aspergillus aculeatinus CBS 121060]|uniref:Geranylgeranyl pyrophosphate synthetase n=1 Tax=Aspergillus aculeatinus CBS 121060 TaxID=1448322 RepID=A0ACD1HDC7_9EURO|nr:geranylgeranyl pyrophosphate synthetase [Aspergillus aculeatinus CBS 121060]RAH71548.1 geranylgeranyl pyrophosphate synthetase [Aspergillus aculeatinus CBS 121060]